MDMNIDDFLEEKYVKTESTEYKRVLIRLTLYKANTKRIYIFLYYMENYRA